MWTEHISCGLSEYTNEPSASIKMGNFFDWLSNYQLPRKCPAPCYTSRKRKFSLSRRSTKQKRIKQNDSLNGLKRLASCSSRLSSQNHWIEFCTSCIYSLGLSAHSWLTARQFLNDIWSKWQVFSCLGSYRSVSLVASNRESGNSYITYKQNKKFKTAECE